ncbi:hypothetical protein T492DRAFT_865300 [Pavlovales sp. CCMP2436]|nr:hypothetical protein T492DRAFT_865300 [Pavlovales sp. CCMP2436]
MRDFVLEQIAQSQSRSILLNVMQRGLFPNTPRLARFSRLSTRGGLGAEPSERPERASHMFGCFDVPEVVVAALKPRDDPFVLMRYGHDVLRCAIKELDDALKLENGGSPDDGTDSNTIFHEAWKEFIRFQHIYHAIEEGTNGKAEGFFKMLDPLLGITPPNPAAPVMRVSR